MKWWNIKSLLIVVAMLLCCIPSLEAQQDTLVDKRALQYAHRIEKYHEYWDRLIPQYVKIQYAGSMGFISFGTGWAYGKNKQWETDFIIGYLPKYETTDSKLTFTLKQNFMPWKLPLGNKSKGFVFEPLACGMYINTLFGHNYWSKEPDRNSSGYYTFATKLRFNVYVGQRITYNIKQEKRFFVKSATFFYEISTNDIYIVQGIRNDYLKPKDCIHLSFGCKFQFL